MGDDYATLRVEAYLAWVALRALDQIYQPTFDEVKRSIFFRFRSDQMSEAEHVESVFTSQGPRQASPQQYGRFWNVLTCNLCQRFAYLMGKISKHDEGVRTFFECVALTNDNRGTVLFSFLQQALLMKFYQPGGIEPALIENGQELVEIKRQENVDLRRQHQALSEMAARNIQRLQELRRELQRVIDGEPCTRLCTTILMAKTL